LYLAKGTRRLLIVLALALSVAHASSQPRPLSRPGAAAKKSSIPQGSIAVNLVALPGSSALSASSTGQGTMSLGKVPSGVGTPTKGVAIDRRANSTVVRTSFGIRLDDAGVAAGSATLSAFLFHPDPRCDISVDGVKLGATAHVIQASVGYGVITPHRLEIEIPSSVPESQGDLANSIVFLAIPN
jgi:hypothetical protein